MGKHEITALPLGEADRAKSIETANAVFEAVLERLDLENPDPVRKLWNAEEYVDHAFLNEGMLPISFDYALSLIEAFLVHYVLGLIEKAESCRGPHGARVLH
ncbi:MAG: hypothetical protein JSR91_06485 [Proteobacteria bacterium]|nr:hypothetical protein [Pseudomonadota bacterium]